jgi:hypothetical protein
MSVPDRAKMSDPNPTRERDMNRVGQTMREYAAKGFSIVLRPEDMLEIADRVEWLEDRVRKSTPEMLIRLETEVERLREACPVEFEPEDELEASELICERRMRGLPTADLERKWGIS